MATIQESRFLDTVPARLTAISNALNAMKPRLVCICKRDGNENYVNPSSVSVVTCIDGIVYVGVDGNSMKTDFTTAAEAIKALGMAE